MDYRMFLLIILISSCASSNPVNETLFSDTLNILSNDYSLRSDIISFEGIKELSVGNYLLWEITMDKDKTYLLSCSFYSDIGNFDVTAALDENNLLLFINNYAFQSECESLDVINSQINDCHITSEYKYIAIRSQNYIKDQMIEYKIEIQLEVNNDDINSSYYLSINIYIVILISILSLL